MEAKSEGAIPKSEHAVPTAPYRPGVFDRLMAWVDGLPGSAWLFYLLLLAALIALFHAVAWLGGALPVGKFDLFRASIPCYPVFALALMHYLNRRARSALAAFRPALQVDDAGFDRLAYGLTHLRRRGTLIALTLSLPITLAYVVFALDLEAAFASSRWIFPIDVLFYGLVWALLTVFAYHTIRQLRMVSAIHASADRLSLFHRAPLYAFSRLTAQTGIAWLLLNYFGILTDPTTFDNPALLGVVIAAAAFALACFILPLLGMLRRLTAEKRRLLGETDARLEATIEQIHRRADDETPSGIEELNQLMAGLTASRGVVERMSIWPWQGRTFTGFFTVFLLPVLLQLSALLIQRLT